MLAKGRIELARQNRDSEHLGAAMEAIERSFELIDNLLALARGDQDVSEKEAIELPECVEECWKTVESSEATIAIEVESTLHADSSRLRQLFENPIRNSVEHGGEDVTVRVGPLSVGFFVEDNGFGIPEDEREDVFKEGYSKSSEGTGFGLSIAKQIVDAHGWDIRTVEGPSGGTRFEITGVDFGNE